MPEDSARDRQKLKLFLPARLLSATREFFDNGGGNDSTSLRQEADYCAGLLRSSRLTLGY